MNVSQETDPQVRQEICLFNATTALRKAATLEARAKAIEKTIGFETLYNYLHMGFTVADIAQSLDIKAADLHYVLNSTAERRKQFFEAKALHLGHIGVDALHKLSKKITNPFFFTADVKRFSDHHTGLATLASKVVNANAQESGNAVIVNNTVVVRGSEDIPPMPDDLTNLLEG